MKLTLAIWLGFLLLMNVTASILHAIDREGGPAIVAGLMFAINLTLFVLLLGGSW